MYNGQLIADVHFWRAYLTRGHPRMMLSFGQQSLVIDGQLLSADVKWPGVRDDAIPFANTEVEDDLFTSAAYAHALADMYPDAELNELELDDIAVLEEEAAADEDAVSDDEEGSSDSAQDPLP